MNEPVRIDGALLKFCRESAALSREDLALRLDTEPPIAHRLRAEWLGEIEEGRSPISRSLLAALSIVAPEAFGWIVLAEWPEDEVRALPLYARERQT